MLDRHDDRVITALVDEVLEALRTNLAEHKTIVLEAKVGYIEKARTVLAARLKQLAEGKLASLTFSLMPPSDHSKEFETAIKMMELHKAAWEADPCHQAKEGSPATPATYQFKAIDVQRFVLNDWSWMDTFLLSNSSYSSTSTRLAVEKGLL